MDIVGIDLVEGNILELQGMRNSYCHNLLMQLRVL